TYVRRVSVRGFEDHVASLGGDAGALGEGRDPYASPAPTETRPAGDAVNVEPLFEIFEREEFFKAEAEFTLDLAVNAQPPLREARVTGETTNRLEVVDDPLA